MTKLWLLPWMVPSLYSTWLCGPLPPSHPVLGPHIRSSRLSDGSEASLKCWAPRWETSCPCPGKGTGIRSFLCSQGGLCTSGGWSGYFSWCEGGTAFLSIRQEQRLEACSMEFPERKSRFSQDCRCHGISRIYMLVTWPKKAHTSGGQGQPSGTSYEAATSMCSSCQPLAWERAIAREKRLAHSLRRGLLAVSRDRPSSHCSSPWPQCRVAQCWGKLRQRRTAQTWMDSFAKIAEGEAVPTAESCCRAGEPFIWHLIIYWLAYCLPPTIECKLHEGRNFNSFVHHIPK